MMTAESVNQKPRLRALWIGILPIGFFLLLALLLWRGLGSKPQEVPSALLGRSMPEFSLSKLSDPNANHVPSDFIGSPFLINVWGTWCPSCRIEHSALLALAESGVPILGLNYKDQRNEALAYLEQFGDPFKWSVFDPMGDLGFDLGVTGAPETFLIDEKGIIRYRHVGVITVAQWVRDIQPQFIEFGGKVDAITLE